MCTDAEESTTPQYQSLSVRSLAIRSCQAGRLLDRSDASSVKATMDDIA